MTHLITAKILESYNPGTTAYRRDGIMFTNIALEGIAERFNTRDDKSVPLFCSIQRDGPFTELEKIVGTIEEMQLVTKNSVTAIYATIKILDTPAGKIIQQLREAGLDIEKDLMIEGVCQYLQEDGIGLSTATPKFVDKSDLKYVSIGAKFGD